MCAFEKRAPDFKKAGAEVFGISSGKWVMKQYNYSTTDIILLVVGYYTTLAGYYTTSTIFMMDEGMDILIDWLIEHIFLFMDEMTLIVEGA